MRVLRSTPSKGRPGPLFLLVLVTQILGNILVALGPRNCLYMPQFRLHASPELSTLAAIIVGIGWGAQDWKVVSLGLKLPGFLIQRQHGAPGFRICRVCSV